MPQLQRCVLGDVLSGEKICSQSLLKDIPSGLLHWELTHQRCHYPASLIHPSSPPAGWVIELALDPVSELRSQRWIPSPETPAKTTRRFEPTQLLRHRRFETKLLAESVRN